MRKLFLELFIFLFGFLIGFGELLYLFTNIKVCTKEAKEKDLLGRIYEYFLGQFAKNELQKGGEFYTPACLVRTMVEIIEPFQGRVYDPACGSRWYVCSKFKIHTKTSR